jgi:predicted kinase
MTNNQQTKPFILVVYGPLCTGKTTVIKILSQQQEKMFKISVDTIKNSLSDYNSERDFEIVNDVLFDTVRSMASKGYSIVIEGNTVIQKKHPIVQAIADEYGFNLIEVNVFAPLDILQTRFTQRLENAAAIGKKMAITTVEEMKSLHDQFYLHKKDIENEYDSSIMSPEDIAAKLLAIIHE